MSYDIKTVEIKTNGYQDSHTVLRSISSRVKKEDKWVHYKITASKDSVSFIGCYKYSNANNNIDPLQLALLP